MSKLTDIKDYEALVKRMKTLSKAQTAFLKVSFEITDFEYVLYSSFIIYINNQNASIGSFAQQA